MSARPGLTGRVRVIAREGPVEQDTGLGSGGRHGANQYPGRREHRGILNCGRGRKKGSDAGSLCRRLVVVGGGGAWEGELGWNRRWEIEHTRKKVGSDEHVECTPVDLRQNPGELHERLLQRVASRLVYQ